MLYHYYILHVSAETNEENFIGPFNTEELRDKTSSELRIKYNKNLFNFRVRSRFYRVNIADDVLSEIIKVSHQIAA
jgi:hypothetical protein